MTHSYYWRVSFIDPMRYYLYDNISEIGDSDYRDYVIIKINPDEQDGYISFTTEDKWNFGVGREQNPKEIPINVGDTVRLYGRGIGFSIRGLAINGNVVYYETSYTHENRLKDEKAQRDKLMRRDFEKTRPQYMARIKALPEPFQKRIKLRQENNLDFDFEYGEYELMCCEQAVVIANALKSFETIRDFYNVVSWEKQKEMVPGLSDGHSGHTFGVSCKLAQMYLSDHPEENVVRLQGAMSAVVGSEAYGDISVA